MLYTYQTTANWSNRKPEVWNTSGPKPVESEATNLDIPAYLHPMTQLFAEIHMLLKGEEN